MIDFESQSARILLALAGGRSGMDAARCARAFSHLGTAARIQREIRRALARHRLSDLQFAILVLLLQAGLESVPVSKLASHAGVSRSSTTVALDNLEGVGFASRLRDRLDRRVIQVRITAAGSDKAQRAIDDYLGAVERAARAAGLERQAGNPMTGEPRGAHAKHAVPR